MSPLDINRLAARPAASITDDEVATALDVIRADDRVSSVESSGRDNLGRPMLSVEMQGLSGTHSLGRVISQISQLNPKPAPYVDPRTAATRAKSAATRAANKAKKDELEASVALIDDTVHRLANPKTRRRQLEDAARIRIEFLRSISDDERAEFERAFISQSKWFDLAKMSTEEKLRHLRGMKAHNLLFMARP